MIASSNIIRKEFLENIQNQRFAVSLVLVALISWTSTLVLTKSYNERVQDYHRQVNLQNRMVDEYFHLRGWDGGMMMPPKPPPLLSSLVEGVHRGFALYGSIDENPVPILFPFMDILFVVGILMSIAALTLAHDRISGEKQDGTLRLMLSGAYGRGAILISKWIGGLLSIWVILVVSLLGSILIAHTLSDSSWSATESIALLALLIVSGLYCAVFYSLGLAISARTSSSSDSIILALMGFVLFVVILPTVPPYVASILHPGPSPARVQYEAFVVLKQQEEEAYEKLWRQHAATGMRREEIETAIKPEQEKLSAEFEAKTDALKTSAVRGSMMHEVITALLQSMSPFSCYVLAGAECTATGAYNQVHFITEAQRYVSTLYRDYLPGKEAQARRTDPQFTNTTKLDIRDRPRFTYRDESISYRLLASFAHTVFLLVYTALFLLLAWKAFLRYDVR